MPAPAVLLPDNLPQTCLLYTSEVTLTYVRNGVTDTLSMMTNADYEIGVAARGGENTADGSETSELLGSFLGEKIFHLAYVAFPLSLPAYLWG